MKQDMKFKNTVNTLIRHKYIFFAIALCITTAFFFWVAVLAIKFFVDIGPSYTKGVVVSASDGDTITVKYGLKNEKVRLADIDCPEKDQPFGLEAKAFCESLCLGKLVDVRYTNKDRNGRIIGTVKLENGNLLNQELVNAGMAWRYTSYSKDAIIDKLEESAKRRRVGLWAAPSPIPPWQWRKDKRERTKLPQRFLDKVIP